MPLDTPITAMTRGGDTLFLSSEKKLYYAQEPMGYLHSQEWERFNNQWNKSQVSALHLQDLTLNPILFIGTKSAGILAFELDPEKKPSKNVSPDYKALPHEGHAVLDIQSIETPDGVKVLALLDTKGLYECVSRSTWKIIGPETHTIKDWATGEASPSQIHAFHILAPDHYWVLTDKGIFENKQGGAWQQLKTSPSIKESATKTTYLACYTLYAQKNQLYLGTSQGIYRSSNQGREWEAIALPLDSPEEVKFIAGHPDFPEQLWAVSISTLFHLKDPTSPWEKLPLPTSSPSVQFLTLMQNSVSKTPLLTVSLSKSSHLYRYMSDTTPPEFQTLELFTNPTDSYPQNLLKLYNKTIYTKTDTPILKGKLMETESGLKELRYTINNEDKTLSPLESPPESSSNSSFLLADGSFQIQLTLKGSEKDTIQLSASDYFDNITSLGPFTIQKDTTPPEFQTLELLTSDSDPHPRDLLQAIKENKEKTEAYTNTLTPILQGKLIETESGLKELRYTINNEEKPLPPLESPSNSAFLLQNGTFQIPLTLKENQPYTIKLSGIDQFDNTSQPLSFTIKADTAPPEIRVSFPPESPSPYKNQTSSISVSFSIIERGAGLDENSVQLTIQGPKESPLTTIVPTKTTTYPDSTSWQVKDAPLFEGLNTLTITAKDKAGNQGKLIREVQYGEAQTETKPPRITSIALAHQTFTSPVLPKNVELEQNTFDLKVKALNSQEGKDNLKVECKTKASDTSDSKEEVTPLQLKDDSFYASMNLPDGNYTLTITVSEIDSPNQVSKVSHSFTLLIKAKQTPPAEGEKVIQLWINQATATINGKSHPLDAPPEIKAGRTFVPLRFIAEAFDAKVNYQPINQEISIIHEAKKIKLLLWIGEKIYNFTKGSTITEPTFDAPPYIKNGRTMVPLRAISEAFDAKVEWDKNEKKITITYHPDKDLNKIQEGS
jgi:hypothetical protein